MTDVRAATLTEAAVAAMVADWYVALDRHVPVEDALGYLVDDGLEMRFPEGVTRGHAGFREWYRAVTHRFFDEVHTVSDVRTSLAGADSADVLVVVNWQARIWDPPQAASRWLGFDAYQTWRVDAGPCDGREPRPRIRTYVVDRLEPMPGSASL